MLDSRIVSLQSLLFSQSALAEAALRPAIGVPRSLTQSDYFTVQSMREQLCIGQPITDILFMPKTPPRQSLTFLDSPLQGEIVRFLLHLHP